MQEHLSHFQKILIDLLSVGEKIEEKTRASVLLALLPLSYEFLMIVLLVRKSTIKMDEVTMAILQSEAPRRENPTSSSSSGSSALTIFGRTDGGRWCDRRSRRRRSKSRMRDLNKIRCYQYDELGASSQRLPTIKRSDEGYYSDGQ